MKGRGQLPKTNMSVTQELPKYLRGFHKCSREDAVHLAGLIYKAQFDNDRSQLASIPKILRELVPENLTRLMSSEEWKKVLDGAGEGALGYMGARPCTGKMGTFWAWRVCWVCECRSFPMPSTAPGRWVLYVQRTHLALSALKAGRRHTGASLDWGLSDPVWRACSGPGPHSGPHWPLPPPEHPSGL